MEQSPEAGGQPPVEQKRVVDSEFDVYWDGDEDPENPMCWSARRKWTIVAIVSFITFLT